MNVPFVDLKAQYDSIRDEITPAIQKVLDTTAFVMGPGVLDFEKQYAEYLGVGHVIATSDGTNAIQVVLRALGIGVGDEVIVPAHTFIATAEAVSLVGATPVFADVDANSYLVTAEEVAAKITEKTKAILPVHLYGQAVAMEPIRTLAREKNIFVVEDAAQAHGTLYNGKRVGGGSTASTWSFYPGKNLGTYGEGGAVATDDDALAERVRLVRDHGSKIKYEHEILGGNFRMSGIEGAVLQVKLRHLDAWNEARRTHAARYRELLADVGDISLPSEPTHSTGNYHLFVIQTDRRDELGAFLKERGIHTGIHYPVPVHLQKPYEQLGYGEGAYPITEKLARRILSLPMYAELKDEQVAYVADSVKAFFK